MNKVFTFLILSFNLTFSQNQFFKGAGVFLSLTESAHYYKNSDMDKRDFVNDNPSNFTDSYYYPQTHISKEYFSWGAGLFAEFSKGYNLRWQTELEYIKKGAQEKEVIDHFTGERSGSFSTNKYTYIQWNNYLKFYYPIGYSSHWYIMPGIRLEYLLNKSTSAFTSVSSKFPTFWFSGNIGLGYEFPIVKRISGLVEYHWNPDILSHKINNVTARNRTLELRIGVIYRPKQKSIDDCNAPRYNGPAY